MELTRNNPAPSEAGASFKTCSTNRRERPEKLEKSSLPKEMTRRENVSIEKTDFN
tara:strand:- start:112 stop:276 length:165 start_codon:yes stop_codon:yes gene_type:complete